eukprot:EC796450.1.p1 GENE.EC796450.1~~EC796450.1.p1  ORF type:complete len:137 (+),score=42.36 EC796450.1:27-413(+)
MGELFEVVIFTASLSKYANPVIGKLDKHKVVSHRLFREACANHGGSYVKDLSCIGREPSRTVIIDNSPASYIFQPENALPISSWFDDPNDTELNEITPFLQEMARCDDVVAFLRGNRIPGVAGADHRA